MGKMKDIAIEMEEDLQAEIASLQQLIDDSIERGESAEERQFMYQQLTQAQSKYDTLPQVQAR